MSKKLTKVLVIFGGASPEYEVSCASAASLLDAIDRTKYCVYAAGITKEGAWYLTHACSDKIADGVGWLTDPGNEKAVLSPDRGQRGLLVLEGEHWELIPIDVAFPMVHGETGEDGMLPGLLELAGIPYVGSGVLASACSMDKPVTMLFCDLCGIKRPEFFSCTGKDFARDPEGTAVSCEEYFRRTVGTAYPLFVKPASAGSSIGISRAESRPALIEAMTEASRYSAGIIVEESIQGRELKVAVLESGKIRTGDICEIRLTGIIFNSYAMKYAGSGVHKIIPASLPEDKAAAIKKAAVDIFRKLGCRGYARVDFFLKENGDIVFNELNTVPGFSSHSIYPLMLASQGLSYMTLVNDMIASALTGG